MTRATPNCSQKCASLHSIRSQVEMLASDALNPGLRARCSAEFCPSGNGKRTGVDTRPLWVTKLRFLFHLQVVLYSKSTEDLTGPNARDLLVQGTGDRTI